MANDRSPWRNIHIYNASDQTLLAGHCQSGSMTEENLLFALKHILLVADQPWTLRHRASGRAILPSNNRAETGDYDVHCDGAIRLTDEAWVARVMSHSESGRENSFRNGIRSRDGRCVISGLVNLLAPHRWTGFEAAHIFPLEKEALWKQFGYGCWITNSEEASGINSTQNGLLMSSHLHTCFDQYLFSVNPDHDYKITTFVPDTWGIDGRVLHPVCRDPNSPDCVSDNLLRWHFRQSVLANMRGAGEPIFETDFPPGTDMMGTLVDEPYGKERFEMEIESRLRSAIRDQY
ncbi:conserved hypothetical protein [Histoplasma capsulatum var. duboisii H88]|uniref:Uncharacterized protein n=2 Tax=Ajellomyces capsulatus TaxID=5037 RepID=F0UW74_AJEC8|nr:conserved hypothetical protein [Histoplasma capsulatum H143]EGC42584.1 conserved hypothetical protein [Histoplasma capsulatum var. duboisii H88]